MHEANQQSTSPVGHCSCAEASVLARMANSIRICAAGIAAGLRLLTGNATGASLVSRQDPGARARIPLTTNIFLRGRGCLASFAQQLHCCFHCVSIRERNETNLSQ